MRPSSTPWPLAARLISALVAVASGLGAMAIAQGPGRVTTYAGHSDAAGALALGAGFALVLTGVIASFGSVGRVANLALLASFVWFAPVWVGWEGGPPLVRSVGMLAAPFVVPTVFHLVLAYPSGRMPLGAGRVLIGAAYVEATLATLGRALFRDPFFDVNCWANCTDNVFLVRSLPSVARAIDTIDKWFTLAAVVAFIAICAWRLVALSPPARRVILPVVGPGSLFAGAVAAHSVALQRAPLEDPYDRVYFSIFVVTSAAAAVIAAGLVWGSFRTRRQRRAVGEIVTTYGEAPHAGSLEAALQRALGDPLLQIAYWLPGSDRYVDAYGRPLAEPVAEAGRAITTLVRDDRRVALVTHAAGVGVESQIGPAVRLALENERLQAEGLAHLADLRESRARIVERGDAERQRLERDLHDGAQQQLLAVSYDIRLAGATAAKDGDAETTSLLTSALDGAQAALDDLRQLAHGIYPAILAEAGLPAALASFADIAPLRVEMNEVSSERYPSSIETTVYLLVIEGVEDAAARDATHAAVTVVRRDEHVVVVVQDDGSDRTSSMVRQADRVGALGGTIEVGPRTLRGEIPCE